MFVLGLLIQQSIRTSITNTNKEYETAVHISDSSMFQYAMRTNVGNAFVYGKLTAVDTVSNDSISGEWMWIEKVTEKYTRHERVVVKKVGKQNVETIEYYWTWDKVRSDEWHSNTISFLNVEFPYGLISVSGSRHIKTDTHGDTRYIWYAIGIEHEGTIYAKLANDTISSTWLNENKSIKETYDSMIKGETLYLILFWVFWVAITAGLVIGFYAIDNKWLE